MANRWGNNGKCDRFYKTTADRACSHEIKRCLLLETNLVILLTKVGLVKAMVFLVVMYRCESWTIKEAECQRIDVFELWCWKRLLTVPWTARRSNQSILKEINPEYSLEGLMAEALILGHLMQRAALLEKTLMLGKTECRRRE